MNQNLPTPKGFVKTISIIHLGLTLGLLFAGTLFFLQTNIADTSQIDQNDPSTYSMPLFGLAGIFVGNLIFRKKLISLKESPTLSQKLVGYQTISLIRWALLEGPAFANIIWFSSTGNSLYAAVAGSLWLYLAWLRPTKQKIEQELELKGELLSQFRKENEPYS